MDKEKISKKADNIISDASDIKIEVEEIPEKVVRTRGDPICYIKQD